MSLLSRIQSELKAQPAKPDPSPVAAPDTVVDINQRDAYLRGCFGLDAAGMVELAHRVGINAATLEAAIRIQIKWPDSEIRKRLGIPDEPELFTAKEWEVKNEPRRQTKTHR